MNEAQHGYGSLEKKKKLEKKTTNKMKWFVVGQCAEGEFEIPPALHALTCCFQTVAALHNQSGWRGGGKTYRSVTAFSLLSFFLSLLLLIFFLKSFVPPLAPVTPPLHLISSFASWDAQTFQETHSRLHWLAKEARGHQIEWISWIKKERKKKKKEMHKKVPQICTL